MVREVLVSHGVSLEPVPDAGEGEPAADGTFFDRTFLAQLPPNLRREALRAEEQRIRERLADSAAADRAAAAAAGAHLSYPDVVRVTQA